MTNQKPSWRSRPRKARISAESGCGRSGRSAGVNAAQAARPSEAAPTTTNVARTPACEATAPSTGPKSAPPVAAANAPPIVVPRRDAGVPATSQASAPVHENALASPWAKRAASSSHGVVAIPNRIVQVATHVSPTSTVGFTPTRDATTPLGSEPIRQPAGYAAASTPAPVLPRPSVSAKCGSSGVSAVKKRVSKKTIPLVRNRSLRIGSTLHSGLAMRVWVAATVAALVLPGVAQGATVFILDGGGWGHGVGMSQWGAEGYARHGWDYRRILAHYYRHTVLVRATPRRVRVLLKRGQQRARVSSAAPFVVVDARGHKLHLAAGAKATVTRTALVGHRRLVAPFSFEPGAQPLTLDGDGYRGELLVKEKPGGVMVVNVLALDRYLRGVVPWEVPEHWQQQTYEAQAVAARSYTLATLHPGADFDLYPDQRSQMYGGIRAERPETNLAVGATAGQVLTWGGDVIVAYYSSTSGGRTAAVQDVFSRWGPVPYLVSVPDPYDSISPRHRWPTLELSPAWLGRKLDLSSVRDAVVTYNGSHRVSEVSVLSRGGWHSFTGSEVRDKLKLQSTDFRIGTMMLDTPSRRSLLESRVHVSGSIRALQRVQLEREVGGAWKTVAYVHPHRGRFVVTLRAKGSLRFRLVAEGIATPVVAYRAR
jgi:SpoIID/LytB domain protein